MLECLVAITITLTGPHQWHTMQNNVGKEF